MNFKQASYCDKTIKNFLAGICRLRGVRANAKQYKLGRCHEFPWYWIAFLGLLLVINCLFATSAEAQLNKLTATAVSSKQSFVQSAEQTPDLVIVDRSVAYADTLLADFTGELHLLILEEDQEPFAQINQVLASEPLYSRVTIIAKASSSAIYLGGRWIDQDYLLEHQHSLATFAQQFTPNSQLSLYTTNLTKSHAGGDFIGLLQNLTQLQVDIIYMQGEYYEPLWVQRAQYDF
ncbi:DUF4347 domain-containing protein [Shewanella pneumatophori]|uniref:DUF4347 domain-containing protein n=1 Tax=Shewanella pneumatophori TaxID=314092 RepID=A0A9X1Z9S1_9GAMM|nr:DUF4347 domain-containing protein [Shewanella pneumatophori]MCL1137588.1 DUF4347 domain-containing protein [Shewanella pneumatophori]